VKIISGGQTGVDRAALDVALKHGIDCGGWCPAGRLDELGKIPERYPVQELEQGSFAERTLRNVKDSGATALIYFRDLRGGTEFTLRCCLDLGRPHRLIDAAKVSADEAVKLIVDLVQAHKIDILNVAGPRESEWPGGYDFAFRALELFFTRSAKPSPDRGAPRNKRGSKPRTSK
jgi:hypothetical protein